MKKDLLKHTCWVVLIVFSLEQPLVAIPLSLHNATLTSPSAISSGDNKKNQKIPTLVLLASLLLVSCAIPHLPSVDVNRLIPSEGRTQLKPYSQLESDLLIEAETLIIDAGIKAYKEGRYGDAIQLFQKVLKKHPNDHIVRYNMGLAYYQQKRYQEAIGAFEYLLLQVPGIMHEKDNIYSKLFPTILTDVRISLGMAYLGAGFLEKAGMVLLDALPDETAHYNLIIVYQRMGNVSMVVKIAQEYLERYGEKAEIYNLMGQVYYRQGKYDQALENFEKATKLESKNTQYQFNLGLVYLKMGRQPEAAALFRQARQLDPTMKVEEYLNYLDGFREREARIHFNRANHLMEESQLDEAISAFKLALQLDSKFAQAHVNLGVVYEKKGDDANQIVHLEQAVALDPTLFEAYYNLGIAYANANRHEEAIQVFQRSVQLKPNQAQAHYNLGITLYRTKQVEQAIGAFQEAIQLNPTWVEPRMNLAVVLVELKRFESASNVYYHLGKVYLNQGDRDNAIAVLKEALRYDPKNLEAQKLLNQFNRTLNPSHFL